MNSIKNKIFLLMRMDQFLYRENLTREDYIPNYNKTDIVPGNYYPITAMAYIEDQCYILRIKQYLLFR